MLAVSTPDDPIATSLLTGGTFVGLFLGYLVGRAHGAWVRARADYARAKDSVPVLRRSKWSLWWSMTTRAALVVAVVVVVLALPRALEP